MTRSNTLVAAVAFGIATAMAPAAAHAQDLPPDIQADLYLVRADRHIQSQEWVAALEALDVVMAIHAAHDLETPVGLWFRHAEVAMNADYPQTAITSVTRYLQEVGREGEEYAAALALLDEAHVRAAGETVPAPAQTPPMPVADVEPEEAGEGLTLLFPLIGYNAATMAFTSSGPLTVDASQLNGWAGGLAVAFPLPVGGGRFGAQIGAHYAQKGARVAQGDGNVAANADISFKSVDFTALARISPPRTLDLPVYMLIGPYASLEVECRVAVDATTGTGRFTASDDCGSANLDTQPIDFGLSAGLGFEMGLGATGITVGLMYSYGLQDIDKYIGESAKHRVLNIHAGVATTF